MNKAKMVQAADLQDDIARQKADLEAKKAQYGID